MNSLSPVSAQNPQSLLPETCTGISLEDLNAQAAMQTRIDRKYLVDALTASRILQDLPANAQVLEINGLREFAYESVYFDTPKLSSYMLAALGRRNRYKVRTRSYLDTGATYLEVKTEGARAVTVKERIKYPVRDRARLNAEGLAYVGESLTGLLEEDPSLFSPVLTTGYRRTTVFLPESADNPIDARMTIDTSLVWTPMSEFALNSHLPYREGTEYTAPGMVIIETKSGTAPSIADKMLWRGGVRPTKISKFATGMAALNPYLPSNKWHRTIARSMQLVPREKAVVAKAA